IRQRLQKRIKDEIHAKVLGQAESRLAQCVGFGPRGLRQGKIGCALLFRFLLRRNLNNGSDEAANLACAVSHRKAMGPDPAHFTVGPDDAEPLIELLVLSCFLKFCKYMDAVVGVNDLRIRRWVLHQRLAGTPGDCLVGWVDVKSFLAVSIDHPEDFLNVAGHLLELAFGPLEDAGRVALVPAQLKKYLGQEKTKNAKSRCQGD